MARTETGKRSGKGKKQKKRRRKLTLLGRELQTGDVFRIKEEIPRPEIGTTFCKRGAIWLRRDRIMGKDRGFRPVKDGLTKGFLDHDLPHKKVTLVGRIDNTLKKGCKKILPPREMYY